jgi:hypothetical protein
MLTVFVAKGATNRLSITPSWHEQINRLSPKRQELIRPVLEDPRGFLFLSIRALAERLQTDTATTLRSIRGMGFSGYPEFRRYLHELTIAHATSLDSMLASAARDSDIPSHVRDSLAQDQKNFTSFRNTLDTKQLARLYFARGRSGIGLGLLSRTSSGNFGLACVLCYQSRSRSPSGSHHRQKRLGGRH